LGWRALQRCLDRISNHDNKFEIDLMPDLQHSTLTSLKIWD